MTDRLSRREMSGRKRRNPLNLSLPPTLREEFVRSDGSDLTIGPEPTHTASDAEELEIRFNSLSLTNDQMRRMEEWQKTKGKIGLLSEEQFERLDELGNGNYGVVHMMRHRPSGLIVARKLVRAEIKPTLQAQIIKELDVLHNSACPYIVGFYGVYTVGPNISICMEYMDGLSLDIVVRRHGRIAEPQVGRITYAVVNGLTYLYETWKILHRDVKPSNILVNSAGELKLCDFGVSCTLIDSMANSFVGTRSYMAPERLTGGRYNVKSDIWSFGLSLVEMAIGRFPIPVPSRREYARLFDVPEARDRAPLRDLMDEPFYTRHDNAETEREFNEWIRGVIAAYPRK
ncbi:Protein kinase MAP2K [Aphelenchoides fujianensis]|nr:Protein kinase MAP2K [Aphelenchoides fujianensis]